MVFFGFPTFIVGFHEVFPKVLKKKHPRNTLGEFPTEFYWIIAQENVPVDFPQPKPEGAGSIFEIQEKLKKSHYKK